MNTTIVFPLLLLPPPLPLLAQFLYRPFYSLLSSQLRDDFEEFFQASRALKNTRESIAVKEVWLQNLTRYTYHLFILLGVFARSSWSRRAYVEPTKTWGLCLRHGKFWLQLELLANVCCSNLVGCLVGRLQLREMRMLSILYQETLASWDGPQKGSLIPLCWSIFSLNPGIRIMIFGIQNLPAYFQFWILPPFLL